MNEAEVKELLEEHDGILHGHFKLTSGKHSDVFVQTALVLCHPGAAERLGHELGRRFEDDEIGVVLSPAVAGLIIAHEIAKYLGVRHVFCERVDGKMTLRRGFHIKPGERVLLADNVITDGKSKVEVLELIKELGGEAVGIAVIGDRSAGTWSGARLDSLVSFDTIEYDPDACPLCKEGKPFDAPGSRHLK